MKTILYGNEYREMDEKGFISRPAIGMAASGYWRVTGAVQFNNFGRTVRYFTLKEVLEDKIPSYQHKNGKQKVYITDIDHGTHRVWMNPSHKVLRGGK